MKSILVTVGGTLAFVCIVFAMVFLHGWQPVAFWVLIAIVLLLVALAFGFIHLQMRGHGAPEEEARPSLCAAVAMLVLAIAAFITALS